MRFVVPLLAAAFCFSCAGTPKPIPVAANLPVSESQDPIIARISERHRTIVVRSSTSGPTYSLESTNGKSLVGGMTIDQLAMKTPELFHIVRSMQDGLLWAGMD